MLHKIFFVLWYSEPVFDILLLFVLFARRRAASFPFFTLNTVTDTAMYIVLTYVGYRHQYLYSKVAQALNYIQSGLAYLMAFELCRHVFCPTGVWASDVRKPLIRIGCIGILIAFGIAFLAHPSLGPHLTLMYRIALFHCTLESILYVGMLVLSSIAGLPWKTHASRIAQGCCAVNLLALTIQIIDNSVSFARLNHIYFPLRCFRMTWDAVCMTYWLIVLWRDEPTPEPLPKHIRTQIFTLQQQSENDLTALRSWKNS